jgi:hypothetical protein
MPGRAGAGCRQSQRFLRSSVAGDRVSNVTGGTVPNTMRLRYFWAALFTAVVIIAPPTFAQSGGNGKPPVPKAPAEIAKEGQRKIDEIAEASKVLQGSAGNPECVWLGRRVVTLLWRDDIDTALRHLDVYDRFGCPDPHIQAAFRCLVRQGNLDPKAPDSLNARAQTCWLNPALPPTPAAAIPPSAPANSGGTTKR